MHSIPPSTRWYSGIVLTALCLTAVAVTASPSRSLREARAAPDNTVLIEGPDKFCMVVPKSQYTDIGDSESPGGTTVYCSSAAKYDSQQGELSSDFWANVDHATGSGINGGRYTQLTGCINPSSLDRLNSGDDGGQYDSSGGSSGTGNPEGSVCVGYRHYIELIEPSSPRACIRCCDDPDDCPTREDKDGCPSVIPGNYFDCS